MPSYKDKERASKNSFCIKANCRNKKCQWNQVHMMTEIDKLSRKEKQNYVAMLVDFKSKKMCEGEQEFSLARLFHQVREIMEGL